MPLAMPYLEEGMNSGMAALTLWESCIWKWDFVHGEATALRGRQHERDFVLDCRKSGYQGFGELPVQYTLRARHSSIEKK